MTTIVGMSNGTLGIGTSVAQAPLHVVGNSLLVGDINITGNIYPTACNTYNLGSSNFRFKDLYLSGSTINLGGTIISRNPVDGSLSVAVPNGGSNAATNLSGATLTASTSVSTPQITSTASIIDFATKGLSNVGTVSSGAHTASSIVTNTLSNASAGAINVSGVGLSNIGNVYASNGTFSGTLFASNLNILGSTTTVNSYVTENSNLAIYNSNGVGPGLTVSQKTVGGNGTIAAFYDLDISSTVPAFSINDNGVVIASNSIAVGTTNNPVCALDVRGTVSTPSLSNAAGAGINMSGMNLTNIGAIASAGLSNVGALSNVGSVYATGTVTAGGLSSSGVVTSTGLSNYGALSNVGSVYATGTVTAGGLSSSGVVTSTGLSNYGALSNVGSVYATGTVTAGGLALGINAISTVGNITSTGVVTSAGLSNVGTLSNVGSVYATGTLTVGGVVNSTGLSNVGTLSNVGSVYTTGSMFASNATFSGTLFASNLSILGTTTTINSYITENSNLFINNSNGTGPGLVVSQKTVGGNGTIAAFYDLDVSSIVPAFSIVDNGFVIASNSIAIGTTINPVCALDVRGTVSTPTLSNAAGSAISMSGMNLTNVGSITASGLVTSTGLSNFGALSNVGAVYATGNITSTGTLIIYTLSNSATINVSGTSLSNIGTLSNVGAITSTGTLVIPTLSNSATINVSGTSLSNIGTLSNVGAITSTGTLVVPTLSNSATINVSGTSLSNIGTLSNVSAITSVGNITTTGTLAMTYGAANVTGMVNTAIVACSPETSNITGSTTVPLVTFRTIGAWKIQSIRASLTSNSGAGSTTVDVKKNGTTILSSVASIGTTLLTSTTGTNSSNGTLSAVPTVCADDDQLAIYCSSASTYAAGLKVSVFYCL